MRVISMCDDRGEAQSDAGEEYVPPAHKERTDPYPYLARHRTATRSGWALQACVRILDSRQSVEGSESGWRAVLLVPMINHHVRCGGLCHSQTRNTSVGSKRVSMYLR